MEAQSHASGGPSLAERLLRETGLGIPDKEMGRIPGSHHRARPEAIMPASGIAEGGNTGVGIRELSARTPTSRRAGCETHKSGSVGAGGG